jgi:hypothetical protein
MTGRGTIAANTDGDIATSGDANAVLDQHGSPRRRFPTARLFCTCCLVYAVHWAPFMIREQFPAITLATGGTLNVERFVGWTNDIFRVSEGRAFIDNNPGASVVGAVPLLIARPMLDAIERWNDRQPASRARALHADDFPASPAVRARREWYFMAVAWLTVTGAMVPVSALSITVLANMLYTAGVPLRSATGVGLLLGFATPVFVRTGYLNHNLLACHAGLFAAMLLWNRRGVPPTLGRAGLAGALAGFAVVCDYSGVVLLGVGALFAWLRGGDGDTRLTGRIRITAAFVGGAVPCLLALAVYQRWAFGSSILPSQHFMPAIEETSRGYRGMDWPSLEIALMNYFDPRFGLFAVCPLLALGLAAPFVRGGRFRLGNREIWLILLLFGLFSVFCAANQYSRLQWSTGIRYLVPTIPGLLLLSAQVLQVLPAALRGIVILFSLATAWLAAVTHRHLPAFTLDPSEFQLSWARRLAEYGVLTHPAAVSAAVLLVTATAVGAIWRREIAGMSAAEVGRGSVRNERP